LKTYYVYMLECSNGSYYTGYAVDIDKRYQKHVEGTASKYTRAFKPIKIAACWSIESASPSEAMKVEAAIKKLTAVKKRALIRQPEWVSNLTSVPIKQVSLVGL
jgi:putative endonuclease